MTTGVLCPHCGATTTVPLPGLGDKIGATFRLAFGRGGQDLSFRNPALLQQFNAGQIEALCTACRKKFRAQPEPVPQPVTRPARPAAERLRELEQLRAEGLMTEAEYQTKRREVLSEL